MTAFIVRRILASVVVLFGVSIVVFLTLKFIPGDAAYVLAGPNATAQEIELVRQSLGLDQPVPVQYITWLGRALRGDLGRSIELHEPVLALVLSRYAVSPECSPERWPRYAYIQWSIASSCSSP